MGAPAGHAASVAGLEIYRALGAEGNISNHSNVSDTAHCSYKNEYTSLLIENIATFLRHEGGAPGNVRSGRQRLARHFGVDHVGHPHAGG